MILDVTVDVTAKEKRRKIKKTDHVVGGGYGRVFACGEDISPFTTPRERASVKKADMCTGIP